MKLPGFSAEASLSRAMGDYRFHTASGKLPSSGGGVIASFRQGMTAGCGPCMELKWPNGSGTGACVKYCCDASGNCEMKECTCSTSGGLLR
jgi:hypothetical protein